MLFSDFLEAKQPSSEERSFIIACIAGLKNKEDLMPLSVYADWLEEHADPFGEFIRAVVQYRKFLPHPSDIDEAISKSRRHQRLLARNQMNRLAQILSTRLLSSQEGWRYGVYSHFSGWHNNKESINLHGTFFQFSHVYHNGLREPIPYSQIPTFMLKAGLYLYLINNHSYSFMSNISSRVPKT